MDFETWWQQEGQFCRSGGGDYEKTFAFRAWEFAHNQCAKLCDERAMKFEHKTASSESDEEITDLRSRAWDFSVLGAIMRERSNV